LCMDLQHSNQSLGQLHANIPWSIFNRIWHLSHNTS
jgi:hypothetical protein